MFRGSLLKSLFLAAVALAVAVSCGQEEGTPTPDAGSGVNNPAATSTTDTAPAAAKFGEGFTFRNGVAVTVSQPAPFVPSASAAGYEA